MDLPDVDAATFGIFVNWLYNQKLEQEDGRAIPILRLAKLWAHAECWLMPELQNEVVDLMRQQMCDTAYETAILTQLAAQIDEDGSIPLQQLFLDQMVVDCLNAAPLKKEKVDFWMELIPKNRLPSFTKALLGRFIPGKFIYSMGSAEFYHVKEQADMDRISGVSA